MLHKIHNLVICYSIPSSFKPVWVHDTHFIKSHFGVSWLSGLVHWTQVLVLSKCGFESRPGRSWHLCPWAKTLNHNCFVLRMGCKAVGPVCCVMHVKEPRTLFMNWKRRGLPRCFWIHPVIGACAVGCVNKIEIYKYRYIFLNWMPVYDEHLPIFHVYNKVSGILFYFIKFITIINYTFCNFLLFSFVVFLLLLFL